jgi:hypothetical protein
MSSSFPGILTLFHFPFPNARMVDYRFAVLGADVSRRNDLAPAARYSGQIVGAQAGWEARHAKAQL